ncbi:MAG: DUF3055 domain-containing protein [Bacillaceae bacterium]
MSKFEKLYNESENANVRFIGFMTNDVRYDYGIIYTSMFYGKTLVVCIQTGRSCLLGPDDMFNIEYIQEIFKITSTEEAKSLAEALSGLLSHTNYAEQYD